MNRHELFIQRNNTSRLYRTPNTHMPRKWNAVFFNPHNSWKHEQKKAEICYNLLKDGMEFITEAEEIKTRQRADVVCLDTGERFEIETDIRRAQRWKESGKAITCVVI